MRHKWKWGFGYMSAVCEKCGAKRKFRKRKSKAARPRAGFSEIIDDIVTLKDGTVVVVSGKTKMPACEVSK